MDDIVSAHLQVAVAHDVDVALVVTHGAGDPSRARDARHIDLHNSAARGAGSAWRGCDGVAVRKSSMCEFDHTGQGTSRSDRAPRESDYSGGRTPACVRPTSAHSSVLADLIHIRMQLQIPVDLGRMND